MSSNESPIPAPPEIPTAVADAWAAVYIDIAEKIEAENQCPEVGTGESQQSLAVTSAKGNY